MGTYHDNEGSLSRSARHWSHNMQSQKHIQRRVHPHIALQCLMDATTPHGGCHMKNIWDGEVRLSFCGSGPHRATRARLKEGRARQAIFLASGLLSSFLNLHNRVVLHPRHVKYGGFLILLLEKKNSHSFFPELLRIFCCRPTRFSPDTHKWRRSTQGPVQYCQAAICLDPL